MDTHAQRAIANVKVDCDKTVNHNTGEMLSKAESVEIGTIAPEIFVGISTLDISKEISDKLTQPVSIEDIEIKPTGEIYLGHVRYRKMLNDAFGMGYWSLRPLGGFVKTGSVVCREYALYIKGKYAASAIGEQNYIESNAQMTWSDACEATKSNVIMRCCKDLGIGLEMWDRKFVEKFKKELCCQVWRKGKPGQTPKPQWRLKESEPFFDETGIVDPTKKQVPAQPEQPQQHKQGDHTGNDGLNEVTTSILAINKRNKRVKATGKEFHVYEITGEGDKIYTTSGKDMEKFMMIAKTAASGGTKATIKTKGDQYNTIVSIDTGEPDFSDPSVQEDGINHEPIPF